MLRFTDILFLIVRQIIVLIAAFFILFGTDYPFLILPLFLVFILIQFSVKRRKKILKYVQHDFNELGYELISERPCALFETDVSIKPTILVNNVPISRFRYISQFERIFIAKDKEGQLYELKTLSRKLWSLENKVEIKSKTRLPKT